ncbi:hypothetical protein [Pseudarthrobacter sp. B4EP4b]|uniref:hypothetical protein n=1 Tax=Pseudarthrobacter sp. B4EP4b TaxID=2590664 RepID=UPI001151DF4A|nr:hypothetical protein [Pseudarthrobacter sp. B4EP4b]
MKKPGAGLLPQADRALEWIRDYGDKDGDGFIEYERLNPQGLINQGWKVAGVVSSVLDDELINDGRLLVQMSGCSTTQPDSERPDVGGLGLWGGALDCSPTSGQFYIR